MVSLFSTQSTEVFRIIASPREFPFAARRHPSLFATRGRTEDMAGLIAPYDAYNLVKALKAAVKPPIHLYSHFTPGMASMSRLKAIEAGVDILDTCMTPYAYRASHSAIEPLVMTLLGTDRDTGFDIRKLAAINEVLEKQVMPKYKHLLDDSKVSVIDINVLELRRSRGAAWVKEEDSATREAPWRGRAQGQLVFREEQAGRDGGGEARSTDEAG